MKKISLLVLIFLMLFCFSACRNSADNEYTDMPKTELRTYDSSGGFHDEYKTVYEYDDKGNVIQKIKYTKGLFGFNVRDTQIDISYTYNENGDISRELIRTEEFTTKITDSHAIFNEGYNYIYDENRRLIKKEAIGPSDLKSEGWGYEYEYDEHGNCVKEYKYLSDGTKELEYENSYDADNRLIKKRCFTNADTSYIIYEIEYTYDGEGKLISSKTDHYTWTGEKTHYIENKYHYDDLDRLVKEEKTTFELDGEISQTDIIEYKDFSK